MKKMFLCSDVRRWRNGNCLKGLAHAHSHFSAAHAHSTDSSLSFFEGNKFQGLLFVRKTSSLVETARPNNNWGHLVQKVKSYRKSLCFGRKGGFEEIRK